MWRALRGPAHGSPRRQEDSSEEAITLLDLSYGALDDDSAQQLLAFLAVSLSARPPRPQARAASP